MAIQTGSAYISDSMTDITTIPTTNLSFLASASSQKVSTSDYNIERQPEIALRPPKPEIVTLLCWITLHPYVQQLRGSNLYKHFLQTSQVKTLDLIPKRPKNMYES